MMGDGPGAARSRVQGVFALPGGFSLRWASPLDMPQIMELEKEGFEPGIREDESVFAERLEVFPAGFMVVQSLHGSLMAYLCTERWRRTRHYTADDFLVGHSARERHKDQGEVLYISSMTVSARARGVGLGRLLFVSAVDAIASCQQGIQDFLLVVNETWLPARRIYDSEGFRQTLCLPDFFTPLGKPPQDALVLHKTRVATAATPEI